MIRIPRILEALDGIIAVAEETGEESWWSLTTDALDWLLARAYNDSDGILRNTYYPETRAFGGHAVSLDPDGGKSSRRRAATRRPTWCGIWAASSSSKQPACCCAPARPSSRVAAAREADA